MCEGVPALAVGFGGEEGEVVGELTVGGGGGKMEGLLVEDDGCRLVSIEYSHSIICKAYPWTGSWCR